MSAPPTLPFDSLLSAVLSWHRLWKYRALLPFFLHTSVGLSLAFVIAWHTCEDFKHDLWSNGLLTLWADRREDLLLFLDGPWGSLPMELVTCNTLLRWPI